MTKIPSLKTDDLVNESPKLMFISNDAIVKMEVSTWFHNRITSIAEFLIKTHCSTETDQIDFEKVNNANAQIESGNITDDWVKHYETCLIQIFEFEKLANEGGFVQEGDPSDD